MKRFSRVTVSDHGILESPVTQRILKNLSKYQMAPLDWNGMPEVVDAVEESRKLAFEAPKMKAPFNHPVALGKEILHLTKHDGAFTKQCPGTNNMLCCQYHIINMVSNCPFDCSYCYLQTYLNQPMTTFQVNEEDVHSQIRALAERHEAAFKTGVVGGKKKWPLRIGTGELSDSLALDHLTGFSAGIANTLAEFENVRIEFKTKSKNIEHLLDLERKDHVVIGWSMNPPIIVDREEHGTARFLERVKAAQIAARAGFNVAFHFDPMIYFEGWQDHYRDAVEIMLRSVPHEQIQWISIGGLRYQPQLKNIALKRRPETSLFLDESTLSEDGKMRYLRTLRTEMFSYVNKCIGEFAPLVHSYLCMESTPVWEKALGRMPERGF